MKSRVLRWKLISFLRKIGSEESILPASILVDEVYSIIQQCLKLETYLGTNFTMIICEVNHLKLHESP